jgi:hypothetical protein
VTASTERTAPATGPGDPAEYDIAATLAVTAADLADAVDDNRPDWLALAVRATSLLDALVLAKLGTGRAWSAAYWAEAAASAAESATAVPETCELFDPAPYRRNPR